MSAAAESKQPPRPVLFSGVRLIDPASRRDEIGDLLVVDGRIAATGGGLSKKGLPEATEHVAARGLCLAPGIVDLRVQLRDAAIRKMMERMHRTNEWSHEVVVGRIPAALV